LGHEGEPERRLEVPEHGLGQAFREALAGVGEQVRPGSDVQGGGDDPKASGEHPDLLPPSDHKRRGRKAQQQNHGHQAESLRLQEPGPFQDCHLLFLRRLGPLPGQFVTEATHGKPERTLVFCAPLKIFFK